MKDPIQQYWQIRLNRLKKALERNHFEVHLADTADQAKNVVIEEILPRTGAKTVSWGGSMTFMATGLYNDLKLMSGIDVLDTFDKLPTHEEILELRRRALLADLYITGTNAVTETGTLVNLDMYGNRVAAITFGPRHVVILVGRNKTVPDLEQAVWRIKNYAAPINAIRLNKKTPCVQTAVCEDCYGPDRICNTWTITEKSIPKGRIKVVLINEDLGF